MANDVIQGFKINQKGYGNIPKLVMQDQNLDIKAKAVYAYFCSYTGAGDSCFPTRKRICYDLKISNDSLSKYIKQLTDNGYLIVEQVKENGRFSHNIYTLPDTKLPCPKISDTEDFVYEKVDTKNNNDKTNNITNKNNNKKERKKGSYDSILSNVKDDGLRELYYEFIKMRKLMKKPMTDRALEMLIKKVETLETSVENQKKILECSIMNNWQSVYPLKNEDRIRKPVSEPLRTAEPVKKEITEQDVERFKEMLKKDYPGLSDQWDEWIEAYRKGEWEE